MNLSPALVMGMWTAGLAVGGALIVRWSIIGAGYTWLTAGVVLLFGGLTAVAGGGPLAWIAVGLTGGAAILARAARVASSMLALAAVLFLLGIADSSPLVPLATGTFFLGAVTSVMMLGHWYLVDPRLPRRVLRVLTSSGAIGLAADLSYITLRGGLNWAKSGTAMGAAFLVLAVATGALLLAVWFALKEPRYTGVMAATGLSYLATLTAIGTVVLGRLVVVAG